MIESINAIRDQLYKLVTKANASLRSIDFIDPATGKIKAEKLPEQKPVSSVPEDFFTRDNDVSLINRAYIPSQETWTPGGSVSAQSSSAVKHRTLMANKKLCHPWFYTRGDSNLVVNFSHYTGGEIANDPWQADYQKFIPEMGLCLFKFEKWGIPAELQSNDFTNLITVVDDALVATTTTMPTVITAYVLQPLGQNGSLVIYTQTLFPKKDAPSIETIDPLPYQYQDAQSVGTTATVQTSGDLEGFDPSQMLIKNYFHTSVWLRAREW